MTGGRLLVGAFGAGRRDEESLRADREARLAAQRRFDRPLVLEAGAGTGKTTTLIARLLSWTLGAGWEKEVRRRAERAREESPEKIAASVLRGVVAITFTEAAAAEMASRAARELASQARGDEPPSWLDATPLPAPEERARRARALLGALDHLAVRTIHAFCRGLLADHPLEAGIHPELTIDADGRLVEETVHEVVEGALREGYGDPGDPDLLALAVRGFGPREVAEALVSLVHAGLPARILAQDPFAPEVLAELRRQLTEAAGELLLLIGPRLTGTRLRNAQKIELGLAALLDRLGEGEAGLPQLREWVEELLPENLQKHLRDWSKRSLGETEASLFRDAREELAERAGTLRRLLAHLGRLDPELLGQPRRALAPRLAEIERLLQARGIATFDALLTGAEALLASHPEVRSRIRRGIDQLLVDEFQDTDRVQCSLLGWIALDGPPEERPGLFLVGDPKQSIYGWRSADLSAYEGFLERVRQGWGEVMPLVENFRSVPAILDEVTRVMEPVMRERAGLQPRFERLLPCESRSAEPGYRVEREVRSWAPVEHWVSWKAEGGGGEDGQETTSAEAAELEAAALAEDARALHGQGVAWEDIAVLLRSTGHLDVYLEALRRAGVPFAVGRDKQYYRRREVIEAAALVRAVLDPGDHLALLTVLRSASVGVPDAALVPLWSRGFPRQMTELSGRSEEALPRLRELIEEAARDVPADVPGIDRVRGWEANLIAAVEALSALRRSFETDPADVFIEALRGALLIEVTEAGRYLGPYRLANLERFFRQLLAAIEDGGGDTTAILRVLRRSVAESREAEEGKPQDGEGDAVQVLTIHGAKGLDFRHVYLAQLHKEPPGESGMKTEVGKVAGRFEYRLFGAPTPGFDRVEAERREVEAAERVRTLYVAMTRAKDRLVLMGNWPVGGEAKPPEESRAHLDLLLWRPDRPDLGALWSQAKETHRWSFPDTAGALWKLPALRGETVAGDREAPEGPVLPSPQEVARESATLRGHRERAAERMARRFSGPASEEAHERLREHQESRLPRVDEPAQQRARKFLSKSRQEGREAAMAAGGAVHRALETWDLSADPGEEAERQRALLPAYLGSLIRGEGLENALARARDLLELFVQGELLPRFTSLKDHVLARELPVLLPPGTGEHSPVGVVAGTIDLLYRDPGTGRLVVADYKTDDVAPEEIETRAAAYAPQGALYVRALREALDLDEEPRFELWFLRAGEVWVG